jgi:hypothetical protein
MPVTIVVSLSFAAFAQRPAVAPALGYEDTYQLNVLQNLTTANGVVNMTNAGFHQSAGAVAINTGFLCANIYVFGGIGPVDDSGEQMQACCTCPISRNGTRSVQARQLTSNLLTPVTLRSAAVKIVWTVPPGGPSSPLSCNASLLPAANLLATAPPAPANYGGYASGGRAWATHWHNIPSNPAAFGTETEFTTVPLSLAERNLLANTCGFIQANGSGFGVCAGCPTGGAQGAGRF